MSKNYEARKWQVWDNERVEKFIKTYGTPFNPSLNQKRRMRMASKLISGKSVLDVGCGSGRHVCGLARVPGLEVVGAKERWRNPLVPLGKN